MSKQSAVQLAEDKKRRAEMKERLTKMRSQQLMRESVEMYMEEHD